MAAQGFEVGNLVSAMAPSACCICKQHCAMPTGRNAHLSPPLPLCFSCAAQLIVSSEYWHIGRQGVLHSPQPPTSCMYTLCSAPKTLDMCVMHDRAPVTCICVQRLGKNSHFTSTAVCTCTVQMRGISIVVMVSCLCTGKAPPALPCRCQKRLALRTRCTSTSW